MARLFGILRRLRVDDNAAIAAEYVLMAVFVAVACVAAVTAFGQALGALFLRAVTGLS